MKVTAMLFYEQINKIIQSILPWSINLIKRRLSREIAGRIMFGIVMMYTRSIIDNLLQQYNRAADGIIYSDP